MQSVPGKGRSLRAAVIGCGKIGSEFADDPRVQGIYTHAGAYAALENTELVAVCDTDAARAERCAARWSLSRAYTDVREMLEQAQPDIVSVCTPDPTHAQVLRTVLTFDCVRGIFAEKPLALRAAEAAEVADAAARANVKIAVNYIRRYAAGHERVRDAIRDGAIGQVQSVGGLYAGGLVHNGSHWIDLARWLIGEVTAVHAYAAIPAAADAALTPHVRLQFQNGASAFLQGCGPFGIFEFDIVGTAGRIRCVDSGHVIEEYGVGDNPRYSGFRTLLHAGSRVGGIEDALSCAARDLIDSVLEDRQPRCNSADGVAALRIAEAALLSLQEQREVRLNDDD